MSAASTLDVLGVGFGPSNLALAIAIEESEWRVSHAFLERAADVNWQEELLLPGSDIQHHALRDLITPANPRSQYGFLSYLHAQGRLLDFLNLPQHYAYRTDYAAYVRWVAAHFTERVQHGANVTRVRVVDGLYEVETSDGAVQRSRTLVVGSGRSANIPREFADLPPALCTHSCSYLSHVRAREAGTRPRRVAVIGGSQSAVEITLDLFKRWPEAEILAIQRGYGYQTKDKSPFTHHVYFPKFIDDFFGASPSVKDDLWEELKRTNYAAADDDVVNELYGLVYEERVRQHTRLQMMTNMTTTGATATPSGVRLALWNRLDSSRSDVVDEVILATGYRDLGVGGAREAYPAFLRELVPEFALTEDGALEVRRDYSVAMKGGAPPLFLNGMCEATHGFGDAGSFSLVSLRAAVILASLRRLLSNARDTATESKVSVSSDRMTATRGRRSEELS